MSKRLADQFTRPVIRLVLLSFVATVIATGCSHNKKAQLQDSRPVETIYTEAHESMTRGNWSAAERQFQSLIAQYPYGPYTEQAQIEIAYAQYKAGKFNETVSSVDRFLRTYPTQPNLVYMYYLRGLANSGGGSEFLKKVWNLDASRRDLASPTQGYNDFNTVVQRYPNSPYAEDSRQRMADLRNVFARHEMDSALYYLKRGAYTAAIGRAKYLLETMPQSKYENDAIACMAEAYTKLGNKTLADDARQMLQAKDPQHPWLAGHWPNYPTAMRKLNPFAGEKSPLDKE